MTPSIGASYIDEYNMNSFLVINYVDLIEKYLRLSDNGHVMYINLTAADGNITFVDFATGIEKFY